MNESMEVFANSEDVAVITCPKCKCGDSWKAVLDKRDKLRKNTNLSGSYTNLTPGKEGHKGVMNVLDISRSGLKTKISRLRLKVKDHDISGGAGKSTFDYKIQASSDDLDVDDIILVEFHLNNVKRSRISRKAVIRWVDLPYIGAEFTSIPILDADLGYYMMN